MGFFDDIIEDVKQATEDITGYAVTLGSAGRLKYKDGKLSSPLLENDFVKDIGSSLKRARSDLFDAGVLMETGGLLRYKKGKFQLGETFDFLEQGLDRLTGRDLIEKQMRMQEAQIEQESKRRDQMMLEERATRQREDVQASNMAAATRRTAEIQSGFFGSPLERNFLGL